MNDNLNDQVEILQDDNDIDLIKSNHRVSVKWVTVKSHGKIVGSYGLNYNSKVKS